MVPAGLIPPDASLRVVGVYSFYILTSLVSPVCLQYSLKRTPGLGILPDGRILT